MKYLGLDLGTKTVGIAISDALRITAQGLEVFKFQENHYVRAIERVLELIKEHNITKVILGYPKNMDGSIGDSGKRSENFLKRLEEKTDIDIILWDERLSTAEVQKILISADVKRKNRKNVVDKLAAQVILQSYLDSIL